MMNCPVADWAQKHPDLIAIRSEKEAISYQLLDQKINEIALELISQQSQGLSLGIIAETKINVIAYIWAAFRAGIPISLLPTNTPKRWQEQLKTRYQIHKIQANTLPKSPKEIPVISQIRTRSWLTGIFSSGTTAFPKLICHNFEQLHAMAIASHQQLAIQQADQYLLSLPLHHIAGVSIMIRSFIAGAELCVSQKKLNDALLDFPRINYLSLVPMQVTTISAPINALKWILMGGATVSKTVAKLASQLPVYYSYGSTELGSQVATGRFNPKHCHHGAYSVGQILSHVDLRLNASQELLLKSKSLCMGALINGSIQLNRDADLYFNTQDKAHLDADGRLYILGRDDEMIISGGENISPKAIESALLAHPNVQSARVEMRPHPKFTERPVAFLQLNQALTKTALMNYLSQHLPSYHLPEELFFDSPILDTAESS